MTAGIIGRLLRSTGGWTVGETLLVAGIIGILSAVSFPVYYGVKTATDQNSAVAKGNALNSAQAAFKARTPGYATSWSGATTTQAKYALVSAYIPGAPTNITSYQITGYTYTFGTTVNDRVTITGPSGGVTY